MVLRKKYLVTFFLFILVSFLPIFLGISLYKPILNVFPHFAELEIQAYYLTISLIFAFYCLLFWFTFKKVVGRIFKMLDGNINISRFLLSSAVFIEILYILFFYEFAYPYLISTPDFRDVGILIEDSFAFPILTFIIGLLSVAFLVLIKVEKIRFIPVFYLISAGLITLLTFKIASLNHYDFAYFAGPINDVLHGKHLLYNAPSQYGFLSIIFLSLIFKFIPLGLMNLTIVNAVIVTLGFILSFILLQFLYKNRLLSLFAIVTIIFLNHTIQIVPQITVLQTSFIRFGMWVLLALSLCFEQFYQGIKYKKLFNILPYIILALSFFWVLDNGTYIILAFVFYKVFNHLKPAFLASIQSIIFEFFKIGMSLGIGFIIIKILYTLFLGISPNWSYYMSDPSLYLGGFGLIALPSSSWHWIIMIGYLLMLTHFIVIKRFGKDFGLDKRENIISFILFYGIFQFSYYMGRSHLNNLHHVIIPFLICFFYFIENFLRSIKNTEKVSYYILGSLICSLVLSLPFYFIFIQGSKNLTAYNFFTTLNILNQRNKVEKEYYDGVLSEQTLPLLKEKYGDYIDKEGVTLVSINDIWYLVSLKMANNIESNNLRYYVRDAPVKKIAATILANKYQYVFVDIYMQDNFGQVENIYKVIKNSYREKERIGNLVVLEII